MRGRPARPSLFYFMAEKIEDKLIQEIIRRFGTPAVELHYKSAWQLLVAVILSAQCTDERVNMTTQALFSEFPDINDYTTMDGSDLEPLIYSTGFYKNKARHIIGAARYLTEHHGGKVPETMEELLRVPGVGRKTANVILSAWFRKADGIVVDTHVKRVSLRLGLTRSSQPEFIEKDLMARFPQKEWNLLSIGLVLFGRYFCTARKPRCSDCLLIEECRYDKKTL